MNTLYPVELVIYLLLFREVKVETEETMYIMPHKFRKEQLVKYLKAPLR